MVEKEVEMFFRPVDGLAWAQDLNGIFSDFFPGANLGRSSFPPVNFWQNDEKLVLTAEVPGIEVDDIDINVKENVLTMAGKRKPLELPEGSRAHRRERYMDEFKRSFRLPYRVELEKVEATFKNGVLQVVLPRAEQDRPRKIQIKAGS
jgi:HSP20 family protein